MNFILVVLLMHLAEAQDKTWISVKLKSIKCKAIDEEYFKLRFCYAKPINRNLSFANVGVDILKPVNGPIDVTIEIWKKFITIFRDMYPPVTFEWCAAMRNDGIMGLLANFVLSFFRDSAPNLFHTCPYDVGFLEIRNINFAMSDIPINRLIPTGLYKVMRQLVISGFDLKCNLSSLISTDNRENQ